MSTSFFVSLAPWETLLANTQDFNSRKCNVPLDWYGEEGVQLNKDFPAPESKHADSYWSMVCCISEPSQVIIDNSEFSWALNLKEFMYNLIHENGYYTKDIPAMTDMDHEYIINALSPTTVNKILEHWEKVNLQELEQSYPNLPNQNIQYTDFISWLTTWAEILKEAKSKNLGVFTSWNGGFLPFSICPPSP